MNTKLILVEGLPGSGKSTTAQAICIQLLRNGCESRWYHEEDPSHPISHDGLTVDGGPTDFRSVAPSIWQAFVAQAREKDEVVIFESRLLQNLISPLLRQDVDRSEILTLVHKVVNQCECLHPFLIYLSQSDYPQELRRICDLRGPNWEEYIISRNDQSIFSQRRGMNGFAGLVQFYVEVREIQDELLAKLSVDSFTIDSSEGRWSSYYAQICDRFSVSFTDASPSQAYLSQFIGIYSHRHEGVDQPFSIQLAGGILEIHDFPELWPRIYRLIPKKHNAFYMESFPFEWVFTEDSEGAIRNARVIGPTSHFGISDQVLPKIQ